MVREWIEDALKAQAQAAVNERTGGASIGEIMQITSI